MRLPRLRVRDWLLITLFVALMLGALRGIVVEQRLQAQIQMQAAQLAVEREQRRFIEETRRHSAQLRELHPEGPSATSPPVFRELGLAPPHDR